MRSDLLIASLLFVSAFVPPVQTPNAEKRCPLLTRAEVEKKLGKPVRCHGEITVPGKPEIKYECFGDPEYNILLQTDENDVVKRMTIHHSCNGVWSLKKKIDEILPEKARGELLQNTEPTLGRCVAKSSQKFECLKIEYWEIMCQGCSPASATLTWN